MYEYQRIKMFFTKPYINKKSQRYIPMKIYKKIP